MRIDRFDSTARQWLHKAFNDRGNTAPHCYSQRQYLWFRKRCLQ